MPSNKVPKKVKTLSKRGGVKSRRQEVANDVPPRHRLSQADVQHTMDKDWDQQYIVEDDYETWYEMMDRIAYSTPPIEQFVSV